MAIVQYSVFWQVKGQEEAHKGGATNYRTAKAWADEMNKQYPYIEHWVTDSSYSPKMAKHFK